MAISIPQPPVTIKEQWVKDAPGSIVGNKIYNTLNDSEEVVTYSGSQGTFNGRPYAEVSIEYLTNEDQLAFHLKHGEIFKGFSLCLYGESHPAVPHLGVTTLWQEQ